MKTVRLPRPLRLAAMLGAVTLLPACSLFKGSDDYYEAEPLPPMKVPEGMETTSLEPLYVVPEIPAQDDELLMARDYGSYEVPRPEPLPTDGATASGVKIQRLGDERWILISAPSSQIWPRVQSFLSRYGVGVAVNDPADGLIETDWVRFKVDSEQKHRYRIWIEQGLRPDTTEIHVVHRQVPENFSDPSNLEWSRGSTDTEREAFILDELANTLASQVTNGSASLLGQRVGGEAKSDLSFVEGEPVLTLRLSYQRAWATVMHSLEQEEFALWDSNSEKGVALVSYVTEDVEERSFIGKLFADDELPEEAPAKLDEVLNHLAPQPEVKELFGDIAGVDYGSPKQLPHTFLIVAKAQDGKTAIYVRSAQGTKLSPRTARKILSIVRRNLI
jgi:outer membrane protein assembly factor BamC